MYSFSISSRVLLVCGSFHLSLLKVIDDTQDSAVRINDCPLNHIGELSYVSGPGVALQGPHSGGRDRRNVPADFLREPLHKMFDQTGNVFPAIS